MPSLNTSLLSDVVVPCPKNMGEQRAIAHILGTLDDKIELNRRMNETLEELARSLLKSWFVDFDPVRAKAEERDTGLPREIADLFPDSFEDSELGEVPRGWGVRKLGELLELEYGKALKAEDRCAGNIPVYGSNGQVGWHNEKLVNGPGIVLGRKGNPGVVTWAPTLVKIARELVETVRKNVTIDWTVRENVRAQLRVIVKRILRKYGYPPDKQEKATQLVLEQAEVLSAEWAV